MIKNDFKWYAEFKWGGYLCLDLGDAESGMIPPTAYVGEEPTFFRTKDAVKDWTREWPRGSFTVRCRND